MPVSIIDAGIGTIKCSTDNLKLQEIIELLEKKVTEKGIDAVINSLH